MPNASIKNEKMYRDLRDEGDSKEKAARISNAAAARGASSVGRQGGRAGPSASQRDGVYQRVDGHRRWSAP